MFHIVLVQPQIPPNTGNIGRLCVATNSILHLIHPLGFSLEAKELKRAGLDYWQSLQVFEWQNLECFWQKHALDSRHFFFSTKGKRAHYAAKFCGAESSDKATKNECFLYFGREDAGLDSSLLQSHSDKVYRVPMIKGARSINLATSVGAVLYEAIRQSEAYKAW